MRPLIEIIDTTNEPNIIDAKIEELIKSRSQLYTSYSVKDKEGKFRSVVDIESVIKLMREILGNKKQEIIIK